MGLDDRLCGRPDDRPCDYPDGPEAITLEMALMSNGDAPTHRRVPVREERRGFWGEWGWTIISEVVQAIIRGILFRR